MRRKNDLLRMWSQKMKPDSSLSRLLSWIFRRKSFPNWATLSKVRAKKAIIANPNFAEAYYNLGILQKNIGNEKVVFYRDAIEIGGYSTGASLSASISYEL